VRFLADEGAESQVVARLRSDGHDIDYIAELAPGITDDDVLDRANSAGRLLVTVDKDFGELVFRLERVTSGVLPVRLSGHSPWFRVAEFALDRGCSPDHADQCGPNGFAGQPLRAM
jgi:hypothetical protein